MCLEEERRGEGRGRVEGGWRLSLGRCSHTPIPPAAGEAGKTPSHPPESLWREHIPADTLISTSRLQNYECHVLVLSSPACGPFSQQPSEPNPGPDTQFHTHLWSPCSGSACVREANTCGSFQYAGSTLHGGARAPGLAIGRGRRLPGNATVEVMA